jgi:prophage antirepressor-like protein
MNALIDLAKCREYLTITRHEQSHKIGLNGTIDTPYFCYKEVSDILGYKNSKDALYRYVDGDDKISLQELKKLVRAERTNFLGSMDHNSLSCHDGKAVYITETGLYSLILASQAPFAKEFKRLVCKTILPSIRKYGSYQVESQLTQAMVQLAIKDKSLEEETKELRDKLVKVERKAIRANKFMKRITINSFPGIARKGKSLRSEEPYPRGYGSSDRKGLKKDGVDLHRHKRFLCTREAVEGWFYHTFK